MARSKVPVTMRAVIARINRKLKPDDEVVKVPRGRWRQELGDYYVLDWHRNYIVDHHVDPEVLGRKLGVLGDWEEIRDEQP